MGKKTEKTTVALGETYRAAIYDFGQRWKLQQRTGSKKKGRRWHTLQEGTVSDADYHLIQAVEAAAPNTPTDALRFALAMQRATNAFREHHPDFEPVQKTAQPTPDA